MNNDIKDNIDRISLTYPAVTQPDSVNTVLPFKVLVISNFSGSEKSELIAILSAKRITSDNIDLVLSQYKIELKHTLKLGKYFVDVTIPIRCLADFSPQSLAVNIEPFKLLLDLYADIEANDFTQTKSVPHWLKLLKKDCGIGEHREMSPLISLCLLQSVFAYAMNSLIHDEQFKALETNWRDLDSLVQVNEGNDVSIDIVDVSFDALRNDLGKGNYFLDSQLYDLLYNVEYGQYGGVPYSTVVLGFIFGIKKYQISMLQQLARLGESCHLPFLAQASPDFFQLTNFSELSDISDITELFKSPAYLHWRSFQEQSYSQYVALTLPGVLRRSSYNSSDFVGFNFDEERDENCAVWGNAAYDYAGCLIKSFQQYGSAIAAVGISGGYINHSKYMENKKQSHNPLLPVLLSERRESELSELGFMPLTLDATGSGAIFHRAHSVFWGAIKNLSSEDTVNIRLGAQIPYLLLVTRVAHYIKVIQRDRLGSLSSAFEIASELNHWLQSYVSDIENPASSVRSKRPFRHASVSLEDDGDQFKFSMSLTLVPHMQYMGAQFALKIDGGL